MNEIQRGDEIDYHPSLTKDSREIVALSRDKQIRDMDNKGVFKAVNDAVGVAYAASSYEIKSDVDHRAMILITTEDLIKDFGYLTIREIQVAFRKGLRHTYGEFYGLSSITFYRWLTSFVKDTKRIDILKKQIEYDELREAKDLTPAEKLEISKQGVITKFNEYKVTGKLKDSGNASYDFLDLLEKIPFTLDEKKLIWQQAEKELRCENDPKRAKNADEKEKFENALKQLVKDKSPIKHRSKIIALKKYFDQLISQKKDIKTVIPK